MAFALNGPPMLLLTDRPAEAVAYQQVFGLVQPCVMAVLDHACRQPATYPILACDIDLHSPRSQTLLDAALAHHRGNRQVPTLFLLRDASAEASEQAGKLGATEVLAADSTREHLLFALKRCKTYVTAAPPVSDHRKPQVQAAIEDVGRALTHCFRSAQLGHALSHDAINRGVDTLIASARQTKIKEWLDVVRRYDDHTYQHCLLVAGLVTSFAVRLGLAPPTQRLLSQAALVHDIGKAHIPSNVLNKPGALTKAELDVMRTHPAAGHAMLVRQSGFDHGVLDVVRHHHEYLDGSGYPDRLRTSQLSDFVRIVTICDIYAALIERRPYKAPMSSDQARAILPDMTGKLDLGLLKAFDGIIRAT